MKMIGEKPLSELHRNDAVDRIVAERRVVCDVSCNVAEAFRVDAGVSFSIGIVGDVISNRNVAFSIELERGASCSVHCAARVLEGVMFCCDVDVRIVGDGADCTVDERVVVFGGRAVIRQRVVVDTDVRLGSVTTSIRGMLFHGGTMRAIPELDLATSAVAAKHAVAIARPSRKAVEYFETRGVDRATAEASLAEQFLCPITQSV